MQVKVCGITNPEDAALALECGADFIGIIMYEKSPRAVSVEELAPIFEVVPEHKRVMVDVATPTDVLNERKKLGFAAYQIHFDLDISMATVAAWSGLVTEYRLWLAPRIPTTNTIFPQILMEFSNTILLDTYSKDKYGGTGISGQNWRMYSDCSVLYQHKKWILAGGLNPENVEEAVRQTGADFIDVSSGVELNPGKKDHQKLRAFFDALKNVDSSFSD